jgi:transketolase
MRNAFASEITALAGSHESLVLLMGDIGNRLFNDFRARYPERFFNCGVAEANMTSFAAGLALCGLRPFTYTITPFATTRCLEQIRVDLCYHNVPVTVVGVGAGLAYSTLGSTHHACEDIAFLRALPNMAVVCPADPLEVRLALRAAMKHDGPLYIRMGKKGEPALHTGSPPHFEIGRAIVMKPGRDVCLLATGPILRVAGEAATQLAAKGIDAEVISFHTIKPLDEACLRRVFAEHRVVVTVEEHSLIGGLGSAIAEWLVDGEPQQARLLRCGVPDRFIHETGDQDQAWAQVGLTADAIAEKVRCAVT